MYRVKRHKYLQYVQHTPKDFTVPQQMRESVHQTAEIFVRHSSDLLVHVIETHQQELRMILELLLTLLVLRLALHYILELGEYGVGYTAYTLPHAALILLQIRVAQILHYRLQAGLGAVSYSQCLRPIDGQQVSALCELQLSHVSRYIICTGRKT